MNDPSAPPAEILAFAAQHNPSKSRVFALVRSAEHCNTPATLEAVATVGEPEQADELCAALNQYLHDKTDAQGFQARLRTALASEPDSVSAAIGQVLERTQATSIDGDSLIWRVSPFSAFPLSACPPDGCPACGTCTDSCRNCEECTDPDQIGVCDCAVWMPPRTAALVASMAESYCDTIHDLADDLPARAPGQPHEDLWPVPEVAGRQNQDFYRRFARAFEDIARDIYAGQPPQPHSMAEEIALDLTLNGAADIATDRSEEFELWAGGLPESHFDFDFNMLQDVLFQDKDYEMYLEQPQAARPGELDEWFREFRGHPGPRQPARGFHR